VKNIRWLNPFFVRMDDLFGYGKQVNADKFWGEQEGALYHGP
jgi:hypothetical protein